MDESDPDEETGLRGKYRNPRSVRVRPIPLPGRLADRPKFSLKVFEELVRRFKEISIEPFEAAVDLLIGCDFFNAINRSTVTLCGHARAIFAMIFLEIVIPIVERIHQMGRGAAGHTPTD